MVAHISHKTAYAPPNVGPTKLADLPTAYVPLTAEGILQFCQSRLRAFDKQIQLAMKKQNGMVKAQELLGQLKQLVGNMRGQDKGVDPATDKAIADFQAAKGSDQELTINGKKLNANSPEFAQELDKLKGAQSGIQAIKDKIEEIRKELGAFDDGGIQSVLDDILTGATAGGDNLVTSDEVKAMQERIDAGLSDLRSGAEISMINLQGELSSRSQVLNMCTNMVGSLNKCQETIAGNIGH